MIKSKKQIWEDWINKDISWTDAAHGAMEEYAERFKNPITNPLYKKVDPKYIGIPNINFSVWQEDDERMPQWEEERFKQGFDETETWSLYQTIAEFILPRLKYFKEQKAGHPYGIDEDTYEEILNKMITTFELMVANGILSKEEDIIVSDGLDLFRKYFFTLWW